MQGLGNYIEERRKEEKKQLNNPLTQKPVAELCLFKHRGKCVFTHSRNVRWDPITSSETTDRDCTESFCTSSEKPMTWRLKAGWGEGVMQAGKLGP